MRLLEQTALALEKGAVCDATGQPRAAINHDERGVASLHRAVSVILDSFNLNLSATHLDPDALRSYWRG